MGHAWQAALVAFSLAAESCSAYVIKQVRLVNSTLLPVGYTFMDRISDQNKTLSEVSACRFIDDERAVLVGDSGEIFMARIVLQDANLLNVTIESNLAQRRFCILYAASFDVQSICASHVHSFVLCRSQLNLTIPGFDDAPDSEGCELVGDAFLVSLEAPLKVLRFNLTTGQSIDEPPTYEVPTSVSTRFSANQGFEALTSFDNSWLVTTTETHLHGDPSGEHQLLIWNATHGGLPVFKQNYSASAWSAAGNKKLAVNEFERVPSETEAILSLERGFDAGLDTNMVRLFEVDLSFREARKRLLMEWSLSRLRSVPDGMRYDLPVDNYEAMCLFPNSTKLLLVNDDNQNPKQIGTQFVVLDLVLYDDKLSPLDESYRNFNDETPIYPANSNNNKSGKSDSKDASIELALLVILIALFVSAACIFGIYRLKRRSHQAYGRAKADFAPLGELDLDDVVTKIELKTLHGGDSRSNRMDEIIL